VRLLVETGSYDKALEFLAPPHHFRKWEGLGNIHSTYVDAHLLRGIDLLEAGDPLQGIRDFQAALEYPENLETAPPYEGAREAEIYYWLGRAFEAAGKKAEAMDFYRKSASAPRSGGRPALDFFRASSLRKLGRPQEARKLFVHLLEQGREKLASLKKGTSLDFFAKFGKKESPGQKKARALYLMGLGAWGLGDLETAIQSFKKALNANPGHVWARWALMEAEKD
ncbi:MAG TPA: tetratricopeptide repeat protein, partial [Planctomycetes bacterium]|nr:tetratricopeptide repeat protein [Planctomycetota bacterium]